MNNVIRFDRRSEMIEVPRSRMSAAAENAVAASRMASDAIERAIAHLWGGNRAAAIHELQRIGFELQGRAEALSALAQLAESAPTICPDNAATPGHGRAA